MNMLFKEDFRLIKNYFLNVKIHKGNTLVLFLSSLAGHGTGLLETFFAANVVQGLADKKADAVYLNVILVFLSGVISNLIWNINWWYYAKCNLYIYNNMRKIVTEKVMTYRSNFSEKKSASMILNAANEVGEMSAMIEEISEIIVQFIKTIFLIYVFLRHNIYVGILVLAISVMYAKILDAMNTRAVNALKGEYRYKDRLTENLRQIISGLNEIKQFLIQGKILASTKRLLDKRSKYYLRRHKWNSIREGLVPAASYLGKAILYTILASLVLKGEMEVGALVLLITYYEKMLASTTGLMKYSRTIRERSVSNERIGELLKYNGVENFEFGDSGVDDIDGVVRFKRVGFQYADEIGGSVSQVSFTAEPTELTAIVGRAGSGKTTLVNLLMRKYKASKGEILIDNVNIFDYSSEIFVKNVALVDQTPFMFNTSIRSNLALVDGSSRRQIAACKRVGIHEIIMKLPNGYNTVLKPGNKQLSNSQLQLLAIARALLTKAEILVFDEAISTLDPATISEIKTVLEDFKKDHTIILITHNKEMMQEADKIIVMENGRVVGTGKHEELMRYNIYYQNIQSTSYTKQGEEENNLTDEKIEEVFEERV